RCRPAYLSGNGPRPQDPGGRHRHAPAPPAADVIGSWLVKLALGLALVGFLIVELGSPLLTKATLDGTAHDAANDAAHEYFQDHDPDKAQQLAGQDADNGHAHLERFSIDDQGVVHVTLSKQARSYVLYRFQQTKGWYNVRVSASAVPK